MYFITYSKFTKIGASEIFFKQKTAYEIRLSLVGSEMCIRDSHHTVIILIITIIIILIIISLQHLRPLRHRSAPLAHWLSTSVPSPELCEYTVTDSACQPTTVTPTVVRRYEQLLTEDCFDTSDICE